MVAELSLEACTVLSLAHTPELHFSGRLARMRRGG